MQRTEMQILEGGEGSLVCPSLRTGSELELNTSEASAAGFCSRDSPHAAELCWRRAMGLMPSVALIVSLTSVEVCSP